ncbi:MAG: sugar phosphate isomerase/epimerase [Anaerolineae bacterium]|nr:sugar phosphate isomerase/epimerase [Anaerolineae bacterium]
MIELRFKICAPTDAVDADFGGALRVLDELGIQWCELRQVGGKCPVELTLEERHNIVLMLRDANLGVAAVSSTVGRASLDEDLAPQLEALRRQIDVAKSFEAVRLCVAAFLVGDGEPHERRTEVLERFGKFATIAESSDVILLVENVPGTYCQSAQLLGDLLAGLNSPYVRASFNPAHSVAQHRHPYLVGFSSGPLKQHLEMIRMRDVLFEDGGAVIPDQGNAELRELVSAATARGFDGFLSLDPGLDATPQGFRRAYQAFRDMLDELF